MFAAAGAPPCRSDGVVCVPCVLIPFAPAGSGCAGRAPFAAALEGAEYGKGTPFAAPAGTGYAPGICAPYAAFAYPACPAGEAYVAWAWMACCCACICCSILGPLSDSQANVNAVFAGVVVDGALAD